MQEIMMVLCGDDGLPTVKLHGLRMLAPASTFHYRRQIRRWLRAM
jgi:hypothetical protein